MVSYDNELLSYLIDSSGVKGTNLELFKLSMRKLRESVASGKGGNVTSFFQVREIRGPVLAIGTRLSQSQLRLLVQNFGFLKKSTVWGAP